MLVWGELDTEFIQGQRWAPSFSIMPDDNRKSEPGEIDPANVEKLLEIELMQKRAAWQQAKTRRGTWRTLSFLFLFVVLVVAVVTFYLFFSGDRMEGLKAGAVHREATGSSATPAPR